MEVYYNRNNKILHLKNCENLKYKEDFDLINLFDEELNTVKFCKGCNCSFKYKFFKEVQFYCKQLKLKMDFKFNLFFIKSKFNNWRFELPNDENQKIILYHINLLYSNNNDDFHIQFRRNISAEKIVKYIYCHDYFKYTCFNTNNKEENMLKKSIIIYIHILKIMNLIYIIMMKIKIMLYLIK